MSNFSEGRFYEAEFPELEDVVVVQVKRIVDMGAYVSLLEYNGKEGMMLLSELSKRRIRSVSKLLRVGRNEICMILRVDKEKGYIDLSKRRVDPEDAAAKEESFARAKAVHGIMRHVASKVGVDVEQLCNKIAWPLYRKYSDAFEPMRKHINGEMNIWDELDFSQPGEDLTEKAAEIKENIETDLRRKLVQQALRLRAKIEVSCSEYEGIDAVKEALLKGLEVKREDVDLKINLIAHPLFVITCTCRDKAIGHAAMEAAIEAIETCIKSKGGVFEVKAKPEIVGAEQEKEGEESGSGSSDEEEQGSDQEAMPDLDEEAMKELMSKKVDVDEDDNED